MEMSPRAQKFIEGRPVEVGARWNHQQSWPHIQIVVTCKSTSPESFVGEVCMGDDVILRTEIVNDKDQAVREADRAFRAKVSALFRDDRS